MPQQSKSPYDHSPEAVAEVLKREAARRLQEILQKQKAQEYVASQPSVMDVNKETPAGYTPAPTFKGKPEEFKIDLKVPLFEQLSNIDLFPQQNQQPFMQTPAGQEIVKATGPQSIGAPPPPSRNFMVDLLTPIATSLAAAGILAATKNPYVAGGAGASTYIAGQQFREEPDMGMLARNLGFEPGGAASMGANMLESAGVTRATSFLLKNAFKMGKYQYTNPPVPFDQSYLKYKPTTEQAWKLAGKRGSGAFHILEDFSPGGQQKAALRSSQALGEEAGKLFESIGFDFYRDMVRNPNEIFSMMMKSHNPMAKLTPNNIEEFEALLSAGKTEINKVLAHGQRTGMINENLRKNMGAAKFALAWQKHATPLATNPKQFQIKANDFAKEIYKPEYADANAILYNKATQARIDEFVKGVGTTQFGGHFHPKTTYGILGGGIIIPGVWAAMRGTGPQFAASTGIILGANTIGRLLTQESTARLLINLVSDKPLGMPMKNAMALIASGLNGMTVALANKNGEVVGEGLVQDKEFKPYVQQ